ncbi:hypothetical protein [Dickeya sp. NCPPB 3274]|uniref:hypothetical protein n=1 Tax=Dickeya sp. NCPPB 3274 TaxID=568766 RepID=UPI0006ACB77A|nr:hypothetical protein [Dickeya sp. NCPPB 3274]
MQKPNTEAVKKTRAGLFTTIINFLIILGAVSVINGVVRIVWHDSLISIMLTTFIPTFIAIYIAVYMYKENLRNIMKEGKIEDKKTSPPPPTNESQKVNAEWVKNAYPLQQIEIRLQGTRHSSRDAIIAQLEAVTMRLKNGETNGMVEDDDFGYSFTVTNSPNGPSFFE